MPNSMPRPSYTSVAAGTIVSIASPLDLLTQSRKKPKVPAAGATAEGHVSRNEREDYGVKPSLLLREWTAAR